MGEKQKVNGYSFTRQWYDFVDAGDESVTPMHTSLYLWIVELDNRLNWNPIIGLPTDRTMHMCRIKSYKWYKKTLDELIKWGFLELIEKSKNQHTSNKVALVLSTNSTSSQLPHKQTVQTFKKDSSEEKRKIKVLSDDTI